jgi:hypothetical protein
MDSSQEDGIKVGTVEVSGIYEIQWRITEQNAWAVRTGGEYHTGELPDGRLALLRLLTSDSDDRGYHCRSLYLGVLQPNEPRLPGIELPARPGTPVLTATKSAIRTAFWQYPEEALQIACLTGTGDRLRDSRPCSCSNHRTRCRANIYGGRLWSEGIKVLSSDKPSLLGRPGRALVKRWLTRLYFDFTHMAAPRASFDRGVPSTCCPT